MVNKLISLRLTDEFISQAKEVTKDEGFANFQEFIKDAIRRAVREHKKRKDLMILKSLQGSAANKNIKLKSKQALAKAAASMTDKEQKNIAKEFGLEDVSLI